MHVLIVDSPLIFSYVSMLWISNTLYLIDALLYWSAWYNKYVNTPEDEKPNPCFDGYFWADGRQQWCFCFDCVSEIFFVFFDRYSSDHSIYWVNFEYSAFALFGVTCFQVIFDRYFVTSCVTVFGVYHIAVTSSDTDVVTLLGRFKSLLSLVRVFNVIFDMIYVVDASVYALAW